MEQLLYSNVDNVTKGEIILKCNTKMRSNTRKLKKLSDVTLFD